MIDLSPLPDNATEAQRNQRLNLLSRLCLPFASIKGQNGVSLHVSQGNLIAEINTKELASIIDAITAPPVSVAGGEVTTPDDPGEPFDPAAFVAYESRTRGGDASLIGFPEFTSPSVPARKFRSKTLSGFASGATFTDEACTVRAYGYVTPTVLVASTTITNSGCSVSAELYSDGTCNISSTTSTPDDGFYVQTWVYKLTRDDADAGYTSGLYPASFRSVHVYQHVSRTSGTTLSETINIPAGGRVYLLIVLAQNGVNTAIDPDSDYIDLAPFTSGQEFFYSGAVTYDASTGAIVNTAFVEGNDVSSPLPDISGSAPLTYASVDDCPYRRFGYELFGDAVDTPTSHAWPPLGTGVAIGGGLYRKVTSSSIEDTLTDEDTDLDAITRLLASTEGAWGAWGVVSSFPAAAATYTARTTGFTFTYQNTQLRANYTGMPVGQTFTVKVRVTQETLATGAIATFFTYNYSLTADEDGAATFTVDIIPAYPGYTYRVQSVQHFF